MKAEVIKLSENQVEIDGVIYERKEDKKREPKIGQICEFWDNGKFKKFIGIFTGTKVMRPYSGTELMRRYQGDNRYYWDNCQTITDPLTLGRTMAPEGAEWIAPWDDGTWAFFVQFPEKRGIVNLYGGAEIRNNNGYVRRFEAPTEGCGPLKLWED